MPPQASLPVQEIQFIDESNTGTPQALTAAIAAAIGTRNAAGFKLTSIQVIPSVWAWALWTKE